MRFSIFIAVLLVIPPFIFSQQAQSDNRSTAQSANQETRTNEVPKSSTMVQVLNSYEFLLSVSVLLFGVFVLRQLRSKTEDSLQTYGLTLIVIATIFAMTAHFDGTQIAAAMGLFGTIAGYILGRRVPPTLHNSGSQTKEEEGE